MRKIFFLLFFVFGAIASAQSAPLTGEWKLSGMIYRGNQIPLPNPDLNLRWTFFSNGTERLFWDRGTSEFCERFAHFKVEKNRIHEKVFALNPENSAECEKDPDMQLGRETQTEIQIQHSRILLHFQMGDEQLVYILKQITKL